MTSISQAHAGSSRAADLRSLLPGLGSGGLLLGAVIVAFVALGGVVTFSGLPASTGPAGSDEVVVGAGSLDDTEATSAQAAAVSALADAPAATAPAGSGPGGADQGNIGGGGPSGAPGGDGPGTAGPSGPPTPGPDPPAGNPEPPTAPPVTPPGAPAPAPSAGGGDVRGVVDEVDGTVAGATGIDPGLGEATEPVTKPLDEIVGTATNGGLGIGGLDLPDVGPLLPAG